MKCKFRMSSFGLGLGIVCLFLAQGLWGQSVKLTGPAANTGCGYSPGQPTVPIQPKQRSSQAETELQSPRLLLVSDHHSVPGGDNAAIVGLWNVELVLADGTVFDSGYASWHSDGTELMNSGRPPMTGSFCMGVWKQTKSGTFKLNHVALSWDSTGTVFVGPANIRETITVDPGANTYKGSFTLDQFDTNGNVIAHFAGNVIASRITPD
jgi:hypothetical protein